MSHKKQTPADEARELFERRDEPDDWEDEPEQVEVRPSRTAVLSIRISRDEFDALEQAAAQKGENLSEYVRKAISYRIRGSGLTFSTVLNRSIGYTGAETQTEDKSVWNEPSRVTEGPKQSVALQPATR